MTGQNRSKKHSSLFIILLAAAGFILIGMTGACSENKSDAESTKKPAESQVTHSNNASSDQQRNLLDLVGRWVRTDGGYIIEIRNIAADGKMDAGYFNPRPINVSVAEASRASNGTRVFIELQDTGYPGSTYTLNYDPTKDALTGFYYQAVIKQNFDVVFARIK